MKVLIQSCLKKDISILILVEMNLTLSKNTQNLIININRTKTFQYYRAWVAQ